ncbi:MAG: hypothetical protein RL095_2515 [Verrucomicrobiota bacterium]|jgi:hypothetical protein
MQLNSQTSFRLNASKVACFSADSFQIAILPQNDHTLVQVSMGSGIHSKCEAIGELRITHMIHQQFLDKINAILQEPEKTCNGRSTVHFKVTIFVGPSSQIPSIDISSSDIPIEWMEEMASDPQVRPEIAEKIKVVLAAGYHNWSHKLFQESKIFVDALRVSGLGRSP